MTTAYSSLLGLALPVTGELSGTWGDTVNNYITKYLDSAVAGVQTISGTQTAVTLSVTNGSTLSQAGALGTTGSAQYQIINCTGNPAGLLTITVPAQSKVYLVLNATSTSQSVKIVGTGPTTGVTIISGEKALIAWNGSDFVKVATAGGSGTFSNVTVTGTTTLSGLTASTALALDASKNVVSVTNTGTGNNVLSASPTLTGTVGAASLTLSSLTSGRVTYAGASGLLQDSANLTFDGTTLTAANITSSGTWTFSGGTANGVLYLNGSKVATSGSALTWSGTQLAIDGSASTVSYKVKYNGSEVGFLQNYQNTELDFGTTVNAPILFYVNNTEQMRLTSTGLGVGTSSPSQKLHVVGTTLSYATQSQIWDGATGTVTTYRYNGTAIGDIGTGNQTISGGGTGDFALTSRAGNFIFGINTAEKMRLDTSGNLGIGTSSPASKLDVNGNALLSGVSGYKYIYFNGTPENNSLRFAKIGKNYDSTYELGIWASTHSAGNSAATVFYRDLTTESMRLDSSGNLGLGVTPSAWSGTTSVFQNPSGAIYSFSGNSQNGINSNAFYNGTNWIYRNSTPASDYFLQNGQHVWRTAPSGTAGNAISFTQAMTLTAAGKLGIGNTNPGEVLDVTGNITLGSGTSGSITINGAGGTGACTLNILGGGSGNPSWDIGTYSSPSAFTFGYTTGGTRTERARIDSSGNLLVGKTALSQTTVGFEVEPSGIVSDALSASANTTTTLNIYSTGASAYRFYVGMGGTVYATNTTISAISDQRFKENVRDLDVGLDAVMALKPRKFDWKAGKGKDIKNDRGFIAQEFEQVFPDLVDEWADPAPEGEDPYKSVRQDLIPVLVKAIQELKAEVDSLKSQLKGA